MGVETQGLRELIADLDKALLATPDQTRAVVQKGALNIKKDWQARWQGLAHAPSLPAAVSYDTTVRAKEIEAEIGPDKQKRQGALGNLIEFGSVNNGPRPGGAPALEAEAPKFEKALGGFGARLLGG